MVRLPVLVVLLAGDPGLNAKLKAPMQSAPDVDPKAQTCRR